MAGNIDELKKACATASAGTDSDRLQDGETMWLAGRPAPSSDGTVALSVSDTVTLTLKESDVLDVAKQRNTYLVKVSVDANVLFRQEVMVKADPGRSQCGCDDGVTGEDGGVAARRPLPPEIELVPDIPDFFWDWDNPGKCFSNCTLTFKCEKFAGDDGLVYQVCYPKWNCETVCAPGP